MLQVLQPIWLWASSAVIIPVLIHLWSVKQGKTLKVGSIALFTKSASSHSKSLRPTDLLLLLLRCLLVIALAALVAKPIWKQEITAKEKGWILIERGSIQEAYRVHHFNIDTFLQQGYALHYFEEKFETGELKDTLTKRADKTNDSSLSYWTLLKLLNQKVPSDFPLQLFTSNGLKHFSGHRPSVSLNLTWHTFPSVDTAATWLEKAYITSGDSIQITDGESNLSGTLYTHQNISFNGNNGNYTISHQNGNTFVTNSAKQTAEADTAAAKIVIYTNIFPNDVNYLKAALTAIRDVTLRRMTITVISKRENIPPDADWIFWLSDENIPSLKRNTNLFVYESGKAKRAHSSYIPDDEQVLTNTQTIPLYQHISNDTSSYQMLWKNGYGEPLLTKQNKNGSVYHFYSRFNPKWSDLVWSARFPQVLYNLMFDEQNKLDVNSEKDRRAIDSSQMQPNLVSDKHTGNSPNLFTETDLSQWLWMVAFILFFTERILSFRKQRTQPV